MAGWSMLTNGSACSALLGTCETNRYCLDIDDSVKDVTKDCDEYMGKLRSLFNGALSLLLREVTNSSDGSPPRTAMLGDGRSMDLFEVFRVVRIRGGYDLVTKKGLWHHVVEELGFDVGFATSVKLIYFKYLIVLDKLLKGRYERSGNGECDHGGNSEAFLLELEMELRYLLNGLDDKEKGENFGASEVCKHEKCNDPDIKRSEVNLMDTENVDKIDGKVGENSSDDDEKFGDEDNIMTINPIPMEERSKYRKRKRESLSGMLNWIMQAAKLSDDPKLGAIPGPSNWKEHGGKEFWLQTLRAREALFLGKSDSDTSRSLLQKKLKMHPSMYDDPPCHQTIERLRCSGRIPIVKSRSISATQKEIQNTATKNCYNKTELNNEKTHTSIDLFGSNTEPCSFEDESNRKHVCVGPRFQAKVPVWTGLVSDSDIKFIGTQIWPPENSQSISLTLINFIGKGRQDLCNCHFPGSVECVRFHIAEKRMNLKLELGSVFYHWRFDRMGEEISLRWTLEEEKRFKKMVRSSHPALGKCLWDNAFKMFPGKTRENLVSYYFNAFVIQRRSYQNRVTPENIDSDDDESELGSLSDGFRREVVRAPGPSSLICTQNEQCTELDQGKLKLK